ncbi:hypothetical protein EC968_010545 [Mortierella alpina]|nr:hypothetical protein EC968_010545 [Mortierella alpina]
MGPNHGRPVARSLYTFVSVFRGQRIETLREVSSDEEEHNTQPRLLWPDDGNDGDDFDDTDDEVGYQHSHAALRNTNIASDASEHDHHSTNDENRHNDQYAQRLDEHDTLAPQENTDRPTISVDLQSFDNEHPSQNTLSEDDVDGQESTQRCWSNNHGHDTRVPLGDIVRAPHSFNRRLFTNDDQHSQGTVSEDDYEDEEVVLQGSRPDNAGYDTTTSIDGPPLPVWDDKEYPQEIERGYRSETVIADMAALPDDGSYYCAEEELMTPVIDRPRRNRTTPPIADGFDSEDESDDDQANGSSVNSSSRLSARRPQVITRKEGHNPFIHIPEPQNAEAIHRERARRRAEARDNLGYVIRGQKYLIEPSLYEESEDPELYGPTVLWPSESPSNDAEFTFSCPSALNLGTAEFDEDDDEDDVAASKYGMTLLPIPKRRQVILDTSQADSSEDEHDYHQDRSGDSLARPLQSRMRSPRPVIKISEDEDEAATSTEAFEEDPSTQRSAAAANSLLESKRPFEDLQPERPAKICIDHPRPVSFAGPFEVLKERLEEGKGPILPTFDFSMYNMPEMQPKAADEPRWYRINKSTITIPLEPQKALHYQEMRSGDSEDEDENVSPTKAVEENQSTQISAAIGTAISWSASTDPPFEDKQPEHKERLEEGKGPFLPTFDFSMYNIPELPKVVEEPRWYRINKSTITTRLEPQEMRSLGSTKRPFEDVQPERPTKVHIDGPRPPSFAGPFEVLKAPLVEGGAPSLPTFDFTMGTMPGVPRAAEEVGEVGAKAEEEEEEEERKKGEEQSQWRSSPTSTTEEAPPSQRGGGLPHRGYGSSTYGSGDEDSDSVALLSGSTSRPAKGPGLARPEKHRLEPDTCDLQGGAGSGEHTCSAFDRCWGARGAVVGLYYWDDEEWEEGMVERRKDKRFVLIRDPENDP